MALQDIVNVSISLDTAVTERDGFGVPLFVASHRYFPERIRGYNSLDASSDDIPVGSPAYKALSAYFSQIPRPSVAYIGRREADAILAPTGVAIGKVYTTTVTVNGGDAVAVSYTAIGGADAEDVVDALKLAIDGDADVAAHVTTTKVGTGASATLTISATTASDVFYLSNVSKNITLSYTSTEVAGDIVAAIEEENNDWYALSADDHSETFVLDMAEAIEAREKVYAASGAGVANLVALADPVASGDIAGKLFDGNYFRTFWMYHHLADTEFPECAWAGKVLPYDPGTETWANKQLAGVGVSRDPVSSKILSYTQRNVLSSKKANFIERVGGVDITREGYVSGGEWIDVIRLRDAIKSNLTGRLRDLMINASKIPYTDSGILKVVGQVSNGLSEFTEAGDTPAGLESFTVNYKPASQIPTADKATRVLNSVSFVAILAGAIHCINLKGSLTYSGT